MTGRWTSLLRGRRARIAVGSALLASLGAGLVGSGAFAAAAPVSGTITVYGVEPFIGKGGPFVITGAINDAGTSPQSNSATSKVILSRGTITVRASNNNLPFNVDPTTCDLTGTGTQATKIVSGTGAYKGITGTLTTTLVVHGVARKVKGKCSQNTGPLGGFISITATGPINVP